MRVITSPQFPATHSAPAVQPERGLGRGSRVWLVRHAEVDEAWQKKAYGNLDVPLSAHGEQQTLAMCAAFAGEPLRQVASSNLSRALAMGRGIAQSTGAPLHVDERLREIWRGEWQGLPADEFRARWNDDSEAFFADPWNWKGHRGESDADVCARGWPVLLETLARAQGGDLVLASHFNMIRVLVTRALGLPPAESFAFRNAPAHATLLIDTPRGFVLAAHDVPSPRDVPTASAPTLERDRT